MKNKVSVYLFLATIGLLSYGCNAKLIIQTSADVVCEGVYSLHLQGVDINERGEYFWSYTSTIVKTDSKGNVLKTRAVADHHGDLVCWDGKIYVTSAIIHNYDVGAESTRLCIYNQSDLTFVKGFVLSGANGFDGITRTPNGFLIAAEPQPVLDATQSDLIEYDNDFNIIARHTIITPPVYWGAQNIAQYGDGYLVSYYGDYVYQLDKNFNVVNIYKSCACYGLIGNYKKGFAAAYHTLEDRPRYSAALKLLTWKEILRYGEADKYIEANREVRKH